MKKFFVFAIFASLMIAFATSCSKGISPYQAANGKAKCGKHIR